MRQRRHPKVGTKISKLVTQMVDEHSGSCAAFAKLAGLTPAQLSRIMSPGPNDRPPGVLSCLKLARASGFAPTMVLHLAGHEQYCPVIEELTVNRQTLDVSSQREHRALVSGEELDVIRCLRTLTTNTRRAVIFLIQRAADEREPAVHSLTIAQKVAGD